MEKIANFRFSIHDYHAIKRADLILDGITVLAGNNGCGKSTMSRWLYYIINGMSNFEKFEKESVIKELYGYLFPLKRIVEDDIDLPTPDSKLEEIGSWFEYTLSSYESSVDKIIADRDSNLLKYRRLAHELHLPSNIQPEEVKKVRLNYFTQYRERWSLLSHRCEKMLYSRSKNELFRLIKENYPESETIPNLGLFEEGVALFSEYSFEKPHPITKAIYIDTASMLFEYGTAHRIYPIHYSTSYLKDLYYLVQQHSNQSESNELRQLSFFVQKTIDGEILEKNEEYGPRSLQYKRSDGLEISINYAATGIKSFAILYRLLQNHQIDNTTILIVDEPESHLHPQWVVEYARLLVMINQVIGARIMIASHDPDMVAAIQAVAIKEKMDSITHFYVAKNCAAIDSNAKLINSSMFEFKDLGIEIGEIFESFNIALSRIEQYGG